jgi:hypothetical protein
MRKYFAAGNFTLLLLCVGLVRPGFATAPQDSTWLTDFVDRFDPESRPAKLAEALGSNASDQELIRALAEHFRSATPVDPLWVMPIPDEVDPEHDVALADKAVDHLITTREGEEQYSELLPWYSEDKKIGTLSRFPHFDYIAPAYFHTGDEKYAAAMVRDMLDFIDHVPISGADKYHVQVNYKINPWNWVLLQWRTKRWIDALVLLRASPSLSDENYLRIVHHIWQEIDWLVPHKVIGLHNGTLGNVSAILYTAINFPEAANASDWLADAGHFFNTFLDVGFYPAEFLIELTLGYSEGTLFMCLSIFDAYPEGPLKEQMGTKLEAIVDAHVGMMKPDRSIPRYGDHGAYDIRDRILRRSARMFDRPDFQTLADEPDRAEFIDGKTSFPYESDPYYLSGYYAMRDGWDDKAQYFSMDAGPFGTNHHHGDKLSITVSADGAEFIVDPGTSLYRSLEPGPRIDLRPGFLHNVITVDGVDPNTGWDRHYGFDVLDNRWLTTDKYDYLEGLYEFRNNLVDVIWRRSVLYIKGEYWIVLDALLGEGSHDVESNFQFAIGSTVATSGTAALATSVTGATLHFTPAPDDGLEPAVVIGDTTYPNTTYLNQYWTWVDWTPGGRGWVGTFGNESPHNPTQTHPAPALLYSGTVDLPHYSVKVLSPSVDGTEQPVGVRWLTRDSDHIQVEITRGNNVDVFDVEIAQREGPRTKLRDDRVRWSRNNSDPVIEIEPN